VFICQKKPPGFDPFPVLQIKRENTMAIRLTQGQSNLNSARLRNFKHAALFGATVSRKTVSNGRESITMKQVFIDSGRSRPALKFANLAKARHRLREAHRYPWPTVF
jgi:hypothetical protein